MYSRQVLRPKYQKKTAVSVPFISRPIFRYLEYRREIEMAVIVTGGVFASSSPLSLHYWIGNCLRGTRRHLRKEENISFIYTIAYMHLHIHIHIWVNLCKFCIPTDTWVKLTWPPCSGLRYLAIGFTCLKWAN